LVLLIAEQELLDPARRVPELTCNFFYPVDTRRDTMKFVCKIITVIISIFIFSHLGVMQAHSDESTFLIKLKNGAEIATNQYEIEDDIVYYRFSSYGRCVGIGKRYIDKIIERIDCIDLTPVPLPPNAHGNIGPIKANFEKGLDKNDDTEPASSATPCEMEDTRYQPMYKMENEICYVDMENDFAVKGTIRKIKHDPKGAISPVVARFKNGMGDIVFEDSILSSSVTRKMLIDTSQDVNASVPRSKKATKCIIFRGCRL
jgi:ribosomal protein L35AE/L33A